MKPKSIGWCPYIGTLASIWVLAAVAGYVVISELNIGILERIWYPVFAMTCFVIAPLSLCFTVPATFKLCGRRGNDRPNPIYLCLNVLGVLAGLFAALSALAITVFWNTFRIC